MGNLYAFTKQDGSRTDLVAEGLINSGAKVRNVPGSPYGMWYDAPVVSTLPVGLNSEYATHFQQWYSDASVADHIETINAGGSPVLRSSSIATGQTDWMIGVEDIAYPVESDQALKDLWHVVVGGARSVGVGSGFNNTGSVGDNAMTTSLITGVEGALQRAGIIGDLIHVKSDLVDLNDTALMGLMGCFAIHYKAHQIRVYKLGRVKTFITGIQLDSVSLNNGYDKLFGSIFKVKPLTFSSAGGFYHTISGGTTIESVSNNGGTQTGSVSNLPGPITLSTEYANYAFHVSVQPNSWADVTQMVDFTGAIGSPTTDEEKSTFLKAFRATSMSKGFLCFEHGYIVGLNGNLASTKLRNITSALVGGVNEFYFSECASKASTTTVADAIELAAQRVGEADPTSATDLRANPRLIHGWYGAVGFVWQSDPFYATKIYQKAAAVDQDISNEPLVQDDIDTTAVETVTFLEANGLSEAFRTEKLKRYHISVLHPEEDNPYSPLQQLYISGAIGAIVFTSDEAGLLPVSAEVVFLSIQHSSGMNYIGADVTEYGDGVAAGTYPYWGDVASIELTGIAYGELSQNSVDSTAPMEWTVEANVDEQGFIFNPASWTPELALIYSATDGNSITETFSALLSAPFTIGGVRADALAPAY